MEVVRWSSSSTRKRWRRMSDACGLETSSWLEDRERWRRGDILQVLCPWGEGDPEDDRDGRRLGALVRDWGDDWWPRDDRRDHQWGVGDRWWSNRDGRPASLLVMLAPKGPREGAGLSLNLRWGEGEGEEPRRRGSGERDLQGRRGRGDRWRPSDELVSRETLRLSHRERLAGGDRRLVREEESGDIWCRLTRARCLSVEDLSLDRLRRRTLLPAHFDPALRWARDASRSSDGLSCRSESEPMFTGGTAGPTVCWGGASPTNCVQKDFMSTINSSFHPWIISGVGPWEMVPVSCCVIVGVAKFELVEDDDADVPVVWIKRCVAPEKNPRKAGGGGGGVRRGNFWIKSRNRRRWNRGRAPWERSCETSWRSMRSCGGSPQWSRLEDTDQRRGRGGAPSGPHPGWWRSRVAGGGKRHPNPGVWNLGLESPGWVLEPGEGRGKASSGRHRRRRRTGRESSGRLRGMPGESRQFTPYTGQEVLVRLRWGRRRKEAIQEAWMRRHTVLGHRQWDWAETVGTGPDVTGITAGEEPAITEAWAWRGAEGPSVEEGSCSAEGPKPVEDDGSSSP